MNVEEYGGHVRVLFPTGTIQYNPSGMTIKNCWLFGLYTEPRYVNIALITAISLG